MVKHARIRVIRPTAKAAGEATEKIVPKTARIRAQYVNKLR